MEALETLWHFLNVTLFTINATTVDINSIIVLVIILGVTWAIARRVRRIFQERATSDDQPDAPAKYAFGAMIHYLIVIVGSYIGFRTLGFDLDARIGRTGRAGNRHWLRIAEHRQQLCIGLDTARGTSYKGWDWRRHRSKRANWHR